MRLQYEHISAPHGFAEAGTDLPVGKVDQLARPNFDPQVPGDVGSQLGVRSP
jgi:hypothetical protein